MGDVNHYIEMLLPILKTIPSWEEASMYPSTVDPQHIIMHDGYRSAGVLHKQTTVEVSAGGVSALKTMLHGAADRARVKSDGTKLFVGVGIDPEEHPAIFMEATDWDRMGPLEQEDLVDTATGPVFVAAPGQPLPVVPLDEEPAMAPIGPLQDVMQAIKDPAADPPPPCAAPDAGAITATMPVESPASALDLINQAIKECDAGGEPYGLAKQYLCEARNVIPKD